MAWRTEPFSACYATYASRRHNIGERRQRDLSWARNMAWQGKRAATHLELMGRHPPIPSITTIEWYLVAGRQPGKQDLWHTFWPSFLPFQPGSCHMAGRAARRAFRSWLKLTGIPTFFAWTEGRARTNRPAHGATSLRGLSLWLTCAFLRHQLPPSTFTGVLPSAVLYRQPSFSRHVGKPGHVGGWT